MVSEYVGHAAKTERRRQVLRGFLDGASPRELADRFSLTKNMVNRIIHQAGIERAAPRSEDGVDPMWAMSEDERRIRIAKRARDGARRTLLTVNRACG